MEGAYEVIDIVNGETAYTSPYKYIAASPARNKELQSAGGGRQMEKG